MTPAEVVAVCRTQILRALLEAKEFFAQCVFVFLLRGFHLAANLVSRLKGQVHAESRSAALVICRSPHADY